MVQNRVCWWDELLVGMKKTHEVLGGIWWVISTVKASRSWIRLPCTETMVGQPDILDRQAVVGNKMLPGNFYLERRTPCVTPGSGAFLCALTFGSASARPSMYANTSALTPVSSNCLPKRLAWPPRKWFQPLTQSGQRLSYLFEDIFRVDEPVRYRLKHPHPRNMDTSHSSNNRIFRCSRRSGG